MAVSSVVAVVSVGKQCSSIGIIPMEQCYLSDRCCSEWNCFYWSWLEQRHLPPLQSLPTLLAITGRALQLMTESEHVLAA